MRIEIVPLKMAIINGKKIELGMDRKLVQDSFGVGSERENQAYYFDNELRIDYDERGSVEFIEFLGGVEGKLQPVVYGADVFRTNATKLYNLLKENGGGVVCDVENGYSYSFPEIGVGVYRESIPKNVEEMISEAVKDGYPLSEEEIRYEMKIANYFATFGIGTKDYYKA